MAFYRQDPKITPAATPPRANAAPVEPCPQGVQCEKNSDCPGGTCVGKSIDRMTGEVRPGRCNCNIPPPPDGDGDGDGPIVPPPPKTCKQNCFTDYDNCIAGVGPGREGGDAKMIACANERTRCVGICEGKGGECQTDAQCVAMHGAGSKCVNGTCVGGTECKTDEECIAKHGAGFKCLNGVCTRGVECQTDAQCVAKHGPGYRCHEGVCVKVIPNNIACVNEVCIYTDSTEPTAIAKCAGKKAGDSCKGIIPPGECPKGNIYNSMDGKCDPLYKFVKRPNNGNRKDWAVEIEPVPGAVGTCECKTWITKPEKCVEGTVCKDDKACNGGKCVSGKCSCPAGGLGEFQWPTELTDLYNRLMGRAGEYLSRKPGYSQTALDTAYGKGYENIRNLGKSTTDQIIANLQREGMLGTGAGQEALRKIPWQTEKGVSDVIRDVFLGNEEQKRKDLESYTGIAQNLFGTGTNFKTILESINAARRGEGQNALAMMMEYITRLMNSWK